MVLHLLTGGTEYQLPCTLPMGLRRRILQRLLGKYLRNLRQRQIFVDLAKGEAQVVDAILEPSVLAEILVYILPSNWEVVQACADIVHLSLPWKQLRKVSTNLSIGNLTILVKVHPCKECGKSECPCSHWQEERDRFKSCYYSCYTYAQAGATSKPTLMETITNGLQVRIDGIVVSLMRCTEQAQGPFASIRVEDLTFGPASPDLSRLQTFDRSSFMALMTSMLQIGALSLHVTTATDCSCCTPPALRRFLLPTSLSGMMSYRMPSNGQAVCPFSKITGIDLEMQALCIDGCECQMRTLMDFIADYNDAEEHMARLLGKIPWSDADHEAFRPEGASRNNTSATDSMLGVLAGEGGSTSDSANSSGSSQGWTKNLFGRMFGGGDSRSHLASNASSSTATSSGSGYSGNIGNSQLLANNGRADEDLEDELLSKDIMRQSQESFFSAVDDECLSLGSINDLETMSLNGDSELGSVQTARLPEVDATSPMKELDIAATPSKEDELEGATRQMVVTISIAHVSASLALPEGRAEFVVARLVWQLVRKSWLTESEQRCLANVHPWRTNRGRNSTPCGEAAMDGIYSSDQKITIRSCQLIFPSPSSALLEPIDTKEEALLLAWHGSLGEPIERVPGVFVWPFEVVVRGLRVLYIPERWARLQQLIQPVMTGTVEFDPKEAIKTEPAQLAETVRCVTVQNIEVQEGPDLRPYPNRARVEHAIIDSVSHLCDLSPLFGMTKEEFAAQNADELEINDLSVEQLRAEVLRWRAQARGKN